MTESIGKPSAHSLTGPLRATPGIGRPETTTPAPNTPSNGMNRDRLEGASGLERLMQYQDQPVETLQDIEAQARVLIAQLSPRHQQEASLMLDTMLSQEPAAGESLEAFRSRLQTMMEKFKQLVNTLKRELDIRVSSSDASWHLFFQSLERYLTNLETLTQIEGQILDRKQEDKRSVSKFAERLLAATANQPPEQRVSLLSVTLNPKP